MQNGRVTAYALR